MIYEVKTRELRTDQGVLLKVLDCPLSKQWQQLLPVPGATRRHCASCSKSVHDLTGWSDEDARQLIEQNAGACVYAAPNSPNIKVQDHRRFQPADPCPFRRIQTARGEAAINDGVKQGFWPLVKKVEPSSQIHAWMTVYQHQETGEIQTRGDRRRLPTTPWKQVIPPFTFYPYPPRHPVAAYLVPRDLAVGERVFLVDLIEDRVAVYGNQGHTYRLDAAYALWNGADFAVLWNENKDAEHWIG